MPVPISRQQPASFLDEETRMAYQREMERLARRAAELVEEHRYEFFAYPAPTFQRGVVWYKEVDGKFQIFLDKNGWCQQNITGEGAWVDVSEEDATERNLKQAKRAEMPVEVTWFEEDDVGGINIRTTP